MIKSDHEYLEVAMRAYDNPSCITIDEFNKDLNQYIHIKKSIRKYHQDNTVLRKLVNQVVIYFNCFGKAGTDLLLYKTHEQDVLEVLIPILMYIGMAPSSIEMPSVHLNINTIKQLTEL